MDDSQTQHGAGVPDSLERLWTPHRMAYIQGENKPTGPDYDPVGCPFCEMPKLSDEDGLIIARGALVFCVLNLYPYNAGHHGPRSPVIPQTSPRPTGPSSISSPAMRVVRSVSGAQGFNIGMNQGNVAGAGIAGHLHQHVVPRWSGDGNFMPVIGRTRVLPQMLTDTQRLLASAWDSA